MTLGNLREKLCSPYMMLTVGGHLLHGLTIVIYLVKVLIGPKAWEDPDRVTSVSEAAPLTYHASLLVTEAVHQKVNSDVQEG